MFQTSIKSLTIEPENLLGSIGVGAESARVLSASLVKNPGMLRSLDLKGLKTWNDDDLSSIFRSIRNLHPALSVRRKGVQQYLLSVSTQKRSYVQR